MRLLQACATTSPSKLTPKQDQFARGCPAASRPPIKPEVSVIGKTAARVRMSHRDTKSTGFPAERLVVVRTSFQLATYELMQTVTLASGAGESNDAAVLEGIRGVPIAW